MEFQKLKPGPVAHSLSLLTPDTDRDRNSQLPACHHASYHEDNGLTSNCKPVPIKWFPLYRVVWLWCLFTAIKPSQDTVIIKSQAKYRSCGTPVLYTASEDNPAWLLQGYGVEKGFQCIRLAPFPTYLIPQRKGTWRQGTCL